MLTIGQRAPGLALTAVDGELYTLDRQLTLAIFFKTNCPTCQYAWPFYERLYQAYKEQGLQVLGISQQDPDKTRQYQASYGATFPHLIDAGWEVSRAYDPDFVPTGFLVDPDQNIVSVLTSWHREQLNQLSNLIAENLHVEPQFVIQPAEQVIAFKPG